MLLSTREKLVLHSKEKIGAAQQREKFGAAEQKEKFGAAEQREIWCSVHKRNWCCTIIGAREKKRKLVRTKKGSCLWFRVEFRVCAAESKRDCALKPLVHTKIFSPLAPTAR